ncbi:MAG: hypothetical protein VX768_04030 [Planctomycetota bacterium]|nr:hypothetical protein [Planctomycetota bacterium]
MKVTRVKENGKKFVIREGQDLIEVEFANTYGPNDMEKLKERHPDLHMHVTSFPSKSGESVVELSVSVKEKISAENEPALKEKSEQAFKVFEKYTRRAGAGRIPPGVFGGRIDLGGIELKPAKILELEEGALKKMEEMQKKVLEMRKEMENGRGPLFGVPRKKAQEKDEEKNKEGEKKKKPGKKKDLIDI